MTTGNVMDVLQQPGRLCINPTNILTAFPHGGTALGEIYKHAIRVYTGQTPINDEALGIETRDIIYTGEQWAFLGLLRSFDPDAISTLFPNTVVGSGSGKRKIEFPGSFGPGSLLSSRSVVLLFSPLDEDNGLYFLMRKALPLPNTSNQINMALKSKAEIGFAFTAIRDAQNRAIEWGYREDITI